MEKRIKQAISWLYHHEMVETVVEEFSLTADELTMAEEVAVLLHETAADFDTVHDWANQ